MPRVSAAARSISLETPTCTARYRLGDRPVGDARQPPQNVDLPRCLDLAQTRKHHLYRRKAGLGKQSGQGGKVTGRQVVHLDADAAVRQAQCLRRSAASTAMASNSNSRQTAILCPRRRFRADRARLHVDDNKRDGPVGGHQRHGMTPAA